METPLFNGRLPWKRASYTQVSSLGAAFFTSDIIIVYCVVVLS